MAGNFPFDVFLYYSAPDRATVRALAEQLRGDGVRVWFDEWQIGLGDDRAVKIAAGLAQARLLVLCLSTHTVGAEWPQVEQATLPFRDPLNPERRFLPLLLDNSLLPATLAQFLLIDLRANVRAQEYANLLAICHSLLYQTQRNEVKQKVKAEARSLGHTDGIWSVAWSPKGQHIVSGGEDKTVRVWEVIEGQCVTVLEGHVGGVWGVAWSRNGQHIVSGGEDKTVRVWEVIEGQCVTVLEGHIGNVVSVAWSPNGQCVISGSHDKTVRVWEVESGHCVAVLEGHTDGVVSVAWSPDGKHVLSGGADKTIRVWEVESGHCVAVLEGHTDGVVSVAWSPDGKHVLSGGADKTIRVWEVKSGRCIAVLEGDTDGRVWSVGWSPDGQRIVSGGEDKTIRVWEIASRRCITVLEGHTHSIWGVAWSPDGQHIVSGSADKTMRVWDTISGYCKIFGYGHTGQIRSMVGSPDGKHVLSGGADKTARVWEVESGRCVAVLEGHTGSVWGVAWSPDGKHALSGGADKTVRVWEVESGRCVAVLEGHTRGVVGVAWSPDGRHLISGGNDEMVRVWEMGSRRSLSVLKGHTARVLSMAWSPDGQSFLSGSYDTTVRVWEIASGRCVGILKGHTGSVWSVAWSPNGQYILSGGADETVRIWEVEGGRCIAVLEGHTGSVLSAAWSSNGQLILSGSEDTTVRVWEAVNGRCIAVLEGHTNSIWGVAWNRNGQRPLSAAENGVMRLWDRVEGIQNQVTLSTDATMGGVPASTQARYTNAKVLLVGDTGVGKSALAERLIYRRFVPTKSSHARKADLLETETVTAPDGFARQQEIILWDLAGQPAYRLVHQLSLENATVACVLFDNRDETNPFAVPSYWSQALDQSRGQHPLRKILVAARTDVGGLPASRERIEGFMREHGFSGFIATSAFTGEGCDELRDAIRQAIAWDELPWLSTTQTLAALRSYVAKLKERLPAKEDRRLAQSSLFTIAALHEGFAAYSGEKLPLADFIAHLQRLEATDALDLLVFHTMGAQPQPADLVLLDPTRVDAYASALLIAARDEPDGPGHLLETHILHGIFKLDMAERLDAMAERHLLWFVVENLLARDLALREQIRGEDYLVFPSQCTAELTFPGAAAFGVAYSFAGPVRSIYATLIAQLAHFEGFGSREFYLDAAAYRAEQGGGRCLIRLHDAGRGQGEVEVSFEPTVPPAVRQGFLEFVGKHLEAKSKLNSVSRRHAYHCQHCSKLFDDQVVKARLADKRNDLLCPYCEKKTPLHDLLVAPNAAAVAVAQRIDRDAKAGRQRMTAANVIKFKEAHGKYDVFLSHNSKDKAAVEQIAKQLKAVGIRPWLDKWDLAPGDTLMDALEQAIKNIPCAALCFGPADVGKWHVLEIRAYIEKWASGDARLIPLILPGVDKTPDLPIFVRQTLWVDMRQWQSEQSDGFYRLVCGITGRAPGDAPLRKFGVRTIAEWQGLDF